MTSPKRIQRKRTKGWLMPPNTVSATRPGPLGNPAVCTRPHNCTRKRCKCCPPDDYCCVTTFEEYARSGIENRPSHTGCLSIALDAVSGYPRRAKLVQRIAELRGKNIACFCRLCPKHADGKPLGVVCKDCDPCHADVLLELANA